VPNWSISRNYNNILNSTKDSVTIEIFVTHRPHGAKPQVKGAQGLAGRPHFESVQAKTWWLRSYIASQESVEAKIDLWFGPMWSMCHKDFYSDTIFGRIQNVLVIS
jgi:hypothetical protein